MTKKIAKELLEKYDSGNASEEERAIIESWFLALKDEHGIPEKKQITRASEEVWASLPVYVPDLKRLWPRFTAAASIFLCLSMGTYFFLHKSTPAKISKNLQYDIAPGRDEATLTLSNGRKIILTRKLNGKLAQQGNTVVTVLDQKLYITANKAGGTSFNSLTTSRGEKSPFPLILPDGSKVWLNALSSVRFPTIFNGNTRDVTITGEAYFEVDHNAAKPFRVFVKNAVIEDMGTHFNINAYDNEPVLNTTLLQGKVKVSILKRTVYLNPGERLLAGSKGLNVEKVNSQMAVTWKDGYFSFQNEDVFSVMRQVARWYDVDIEYEGNIPERRFNGEIEQNLTVVQVLKLLNYTNIHFRLEGKKIIITP